MGFKIGDRVRCKVRGSKSFGRTGLVVSASPDGSMTITDEGDGHGYFVLAEDVELVRGWSQFQGFCGACGGFREHRKGCPPESSLRPENEFRAQLDTIWAKFLAGP